MLALSTGVPPAGTDVTITRATFGGTPTTLATAQTDADGNFSVFDTPTVAGTYTYTASYAATATTTSATASFTVTIALAGCLGLP